MKKLVSSASIIALLLAPAYAGELTGPVSGGGGGGSGTVTSIATACGVSGGTITTTGTIQGNAAANAQVGTTYTLLSSDCGKFVTFTNAASIAVTAPIASAAGFGSGYFTTLINEGAGTVTLTPTTSTIDGAASLTLTTNQSIDLYSDGTNYFTSRGRGTATPGGSSGQIQTNNGSGGFSGIANISATQMPAGITHPGYLANVWYTPVNIPGYNTASGAAAATTAYCTLSQIGGNSLVTISALALRIGTLGSSNVQLAIYNDNAGTIHRPGTLIDSTPNIVDTATGAFSGSLNATHQISPGFYWLCLQANDTTVRFYIPGPSQVDSYVSSVGSATLSNVLNSGGNTAVGVSTSTGVTAYGTWPSFVGATFTETTNTAPYVAFQFSSVP